MIKIYIGKIFDNPNYRFVAESPMDFETFELSHAKSIEPFTGGMMSMDDARRLRDFLNGALDV